MSRRRNEEDDDFEDPEERVTFLKTKSPRKRRSIMQINDNEGKNNRFSRPYLVAMATMALFIFAMMTSFSKTSNDYTAQDIYLKTEFSCPTPNQDVTNDSKEDFDEIYAEKSRTITSDRDEFKNTFRESKFDGWGRTYNTMKEQVAPFVTKYFAPYLFPGAKVYESACGIGLNLLMTLEVLQEEGLSGITVYGNEYVPESVLKSEMVLGEGLLPDGNTRGIICTGDSTDLPHVPSNHFDLVYTGYITPLMDPLDFGDDEDERYDKICPSLKSNKEKDWPLHKLWEIQETRMRDWYGKWVKEMARIAKPGAPVIVEQVSYPTCTNEFDWGGVEEDFWRYSAAENLYSWNIDPESIVIKRQTHRLRYDVFMLKNKD